MGFSHRGLVCKLWHYRATPDRVADRGKTLGDGNGYSTTTAQAWLAAQSCKDMSLLAFSEQVINGLIIGTFYALAALGLSLIFGVLKIVNFAHGELYMLGGFVYYVFAEHIELAVGE